MLFCSALLYGAAALLGLMIGSFLNVLIIRLPEGESIVAPPSRCMNCGRRLKWYELIPLFSWIFLKGRCSGCKARISVQYPVIEAAAGTLYLLIAIRFKLTLETLLYCSMASALLTLSVIDFKTYEIPPGFSIFLAAIGALRIATDISNWALYVIGFFAVSGFLFLLYLISGGKWIGGGDIKLMAACGLIIGWKLIIAAFFIGCIGGSVIHLIRMAVKGVGSALALGPYLSAGVLTAAIWGGSIIDAYLGLFLPK